MNEKNKDDKDINNNNNIECYDDDKNKNCQTSFGPFKSIRKIDIKRIRKKSLKIQKEEDIFSLNIGKNTENNNCSKDNSNDIIPLNINYYNTYYFNNNRIINKKMEKENRSIDELKKNEEKSKINPLFTNNEIIQNLKNNTIYDKNKKFSISSEKRKEINYLYGNNNNFVGKSTKNYQTKNNVFLPNLTLRLKSLLPRYERQSGGFIIA